MMTYTDKFSVGEWVYVAEEVPLSLLLNPRYQKLDVLSKTGKRLKVQYKTTRFVRGQDEKCYMVSGVYLAEDELMSCDEHRALLKGLQSIDLLL